MENYQTEAKLAEYSYELPKIMKGENVKTPNNLQIIKINYDYAILKNKNNIFITIRGTYPKINFKILFRDLYNDLQIGLGIRPHRTNTILKEVNKIKLLNPSSKITVIGHILGKI